MYTIDTAPLIPEGVGLAAYVDGQPVGWLYWRTRQTGSLLHRRTVAEIDRVFVKAHFRRQGIATALLHAARAVEPGLEHSPIRSAAGEAWARSTGDPLPAAA